MWQRIHDGGGEGLPLHPDAGLQQDGRSVPGPRVQARGQSSVSTDRDGPSSCGGADTALHDILLLIDSHILNINNVCLIVCECTLLIN